MTSGETLHTYTYIHAPTDGSTVKRLLAKQIRADPDKYDMILHVGDFAYDMVRRRRRRRLIGFSLAYDVRWLRGHACLLSWFCLAHWLTEST